MNQALLKEYEKLGISEAVFRFGEAIEASLRERFEEIDARAELNQMKVIRAMQKNRVSAECFQMSSGYGYNDLGRDTLEKVYADCFGGEDALVRPQITCGTHALALALMSNLRPGDEVLSPVGKPYDTLEEVIGIRPSKGSLAEYNITYAQVDLLEDGSFDFDGIKQAINEKTRLVTIQRSKGYATRPTSSELIAICTTSEPSFVSSVNISSSLDTSGAAVLGRVFRSAQRSKRLAIVISTPSRNSSSPILTKRGMTLIPRSA